nr:MAG TPA: hypothetical protein [Caudoviricetes sp.]
MNYNDNNNNVINAGGYFAGSVPVNPQDTMANPRTMAQAPTQTAQHVQAVNMPHVTSIADLQAYGAGQIVELPPFAEGQPFFARLKRPSLLGLVKHGKIPNELLVKANSLFVSAGAGLDPDEADMMSQMFDVLYVLAGETLVEPSMKELEAAGVELTDEQLMFLFTYGQQGVRALSNFRTE